MPFTVKMATYESSSYTEMQNRWQTSGWSYVSHAALGLDCATQNRHSSSDEVRTGGCNTRYGGLMEAATCKWSVYVRYAVHYILIPEQDGGAGAVVLWKAAAGRLTSSRPLELVDMEGEFEGGTKLQAHVFHHHVTTQ